MTRSRRSWLVLGAAIVLVVLLVGGSGQEGPAYDPRSVSPDGAKGVVETLERLGAQVVLDQPVPDAATTAALMLQNRLQPDDERALERWVRDGGVLVTTDLTFDLAALPTGFLAATEQQPINRGACSIEALVDAQRLSVGGRLMDTSGRTACFGNAEQAFVVAESFGEGTVVSVGSPDLFTNRNLDDRDAAVVALALLAPQPAQARVAFVGPSQVDFGEETLTDLVPERVTNAILQLLAAFLLYALYRSRRLGAVVSEPIPVRIEGSELVLRAGQLSQRSKDPRTASEVIRNDFARRAGKALAVPGDRHDSALMERVTTATGMDRVAVVEALQQPVHTETDLNEITRAIAAMDLRLFGVGAAIPQPSAPQPSAPDLSTPDLSTPDPSPATADNGTKDR